MKKLFVGIVLLFLEAGTLQAYCEAGHWIQSKYDGGSIIVLEDGSVWQVSSFDTIDSNLWLQTDNIVACDDKLINTDDRSTVEARRIK